MSDKSPSHSSTKTEPSGEIPAKSQCCIWTARLRLFDVAQFWMVRSRYSDLKEAALSGAAGLWELDRLELFVAAMRPDVLVF